MIFNVNVLSNLFDCDGRCMVDLSFNFFDFCFLIQCAVVSCELAINCELTATSQFLSKMAVVSLMICELGVGAVFSTACFWWGLPL